MIMNGLQLSSLFMKLRALYIFRAVAISFDRPGAEQSPTVNLW